MNEITKENYQEIVSLHDLEQNNKMLEKMNKRRNMKGSDKE